MKKIAVFFACLFLSFTHAYPKDFNFESTAEGITDALVKPKAEKKVKLRGIRRANIIKTRSIKVVEKEQGKTVEKTITVSEDQPIQGVNLKIEFDVDSCSIRPESFELLSELGKALTSHKLKGKPMVIKGHTDSDGNDTYNLELSLNRGIAVKAYLVSNFSIPPSLLKVTGYGEAMPLVSNNNAANKQINRRVEIITIP